MNQFVEHESYSVKLSLITICARKLREYCGVLTGACVCVGGGGQQHTDTRTHTLAHHNTNFPPHFVCVINNYILYSTVKVSLKT